MSRIGSISHGNQFRFICLPIHKIDFRVDFINETRKDAPKSVFYVGVDLSSRLVAKQVLSAQVSLTSVFGMGTGGPSPLKTPTALDYRIILSSSAFVKCFFAPLNNDLKPNKAKPAYCRSSPRVISIGQLNALQHLHLRPIYHVVYMDPYSFRMGDLILGGVSRLDAFSVYLVQT